MQLSKLEVKGFKSFGDKITVNFDAGITGIVGPNGCGKSNIVDAIRWVLGEQKTKALRSEKMENIIFNGTKNRKPLQMAEVSLTFNNTKNILPTEYAQVSLTRRYYRTGESEYLLNGVTCRLKDITNLFLDTGIGSDSYAIIELKMVDDILNDRDNSRRNLFEEASGISKFKVRKKETFRKLEDTDKDLERVEDLLFEIVKNLKVLERQAKQTQRYFELKEEYKRWSVELAKLTVSQFSQSQQRIEKQVAAARAERETLNKQLAERDNLLQTEKAQMLQAEKLVASRQKQLHEFVSQIQQYENDRKIKNERLQLFTERIKNLDKQIAQDKDLQKNVATAIAQLTAEQHITQKQLAEVEAQLQTAQTEYETQKQLTGQLQTQAAEATQLFRQSQDEVYQLRKSLEINQIQISSLKQELEKNRADSDRHTESLGEFEDRMADLREQVLDKEQELNRRIAEETRTQQLIEQNTFEAEQAREQLIACNRQADAAQNEYNLTKSLVDSLEGFPEAIKFLKKQTDWNKNAPLVSDILTCEEQYRVAIEGYLEPLMNYYVVDDEAQALQAIRLLSESARGKANFFILSKLEEFRPTLPPSLNAQLKAAIEIVEFEPRYRRLVEYLLDNVYLVQSGAEQFPDVVGCTLLAPNGNLTKRAFSWAGGSVGLFEGKRIGRAKNLEKLQAQLKELASQTEKLKAVLEQKQNTVAELKRNTQKSVIESISKEINYLNQELVALRSKQEQLAVMLRNSDTRQEDILEKIAQLDADITEQRPKLQLQAFELQELETRIGSLNQDLLVNNELLTQKSGNYNQLNILFHQQENRQSSQQKEISYKESEAQVLANRVEQAATEQQRLTADIEALREIAEGSDEQLISMYAEKEAIEKGVNEAEREYYALRGRIDGADKEIRELQRRRELNDQLMSELQNKSNESALHLTAVRERLSVEFEIQITPEMMQDYDGGLYSEAELKERVQGVKSQLDKIGAINPMAMEAYNEIKERHDFISAQKQDLTEAKNSLLATISEIDTVARDNFMATFGQIREHFIRVFRSLFTDEDTCDLILTDPNNPLDSSIDIVARPKGKRPLTINQLSGGEKTLTAISLLFAIYLIKPAPFCIFDEVDAPLDDANIDKFNNIIRKFSAESQFIIVTHNKRTMASTDVIYGVTMLEQGVSRVIPVDLRELA
ncbi:condensin subunit Smc [Flexibacter flexilis DSM 6793]|uniref:Chromosome partition protein Smc n=1 Tax=Flexibacter flexilis DSM 6793 TaxID=927664 RepID=A0A1I1ECT0_9BACT|nr:chromosome segregation protein SMC [Flexibacter flexilis]SFB84895.1 condensin subunit Smc [Flexibacter flexilis DSM 6793]